jgi:superfamily II DNA or RNA helicase
MIVTVTEDKLWLKLEYESSNERQQTLSSFTKKVKDWQFKKNKFSGWNGDVAFVTGPGRNMMYPGLWHKLIEFGKKFNYDIKFHGRELLINDSITKEWTEKFCAKLFEGHPTHRPRPDQVHAIYMGLKYYLHTEYLSTSAGKTLIIYCITMALLHLKLCKRILIITPDPDLAIQNHGEFLDYEMGKFGMKIALLHGGTKTREAEKYKVAIGNFQYLANKDESFFETYDCVLCDEVQRAKSKSIKEVVDKCGSLTYRGGYSGSIKPDNYADYFTIVAYFGPQVAKITKKQLMDAGQAAQINIEIFVLSYADEELRRELYRAKIRLTGDKVLQLEQRFIRESIPRLEWIAQLANKLDGNTLIFFTDVKTGYGKSIVNKIKDITEHKEVYYLDGSISNKNRRKDLMDRMEDGMNKVLVANWGVFGVGKSVKNIRYIIVAENRKDDGVINQGTGRGMRIDKETGKNKFTWIDIVDDFTMIVPDANGNDDLFVNYMMKWKNDRIRYYKSEGFDYTKSDIDLTEDNLGLNW